MLCVSKSSCFQASSQTLSVSRPNFGHDVAGDILSVRFLEEFGNVWNSSKVIMKSNWINGVRNSPLKKFHGLNYFEVT